MTAKGPEERLDRELSFHIEEQVRAHVGRGMTEEEARRQATLEFGGLDQVKEECRDVRRAAWLADLARDLRFAVRTMRRNPGFAAVAIATLALGIGANTAVFSLVHRVLIASLPVQDPARLMVLARTNQHGGAMTRFPHLFFRALEAERDVLDGVLCRGGAERVALETEAGADPAVGELVSGSYFEVLGVKPFLGRLLTRADDVTPGSHPVVVLSYRYWVRRFGSDPSVVGRTIRLNAYPMTVLGVSPPGFDGLDPGQRVDVRFPMAMQAEMRHAASTLDRRNASEFHILVRLKRGVAAEAAEQVLGTRLREYLDEDGATSPQTRNLREPERVSLLPAATGFGATRGQLETSLWTLMAITVAVLLIACFNLANLLLARSSARRQEFSIRRAVGAGAGRLARQLLTESLLLSLVGGAFGVLVAYAGAALLTSLVAGDGAGPRLDAQPNTALLLFHLGVSAISGIVFGVAPALGVCGQALVPGLKGAGSRAPGVRGRKVMVSAQVALSVAVLVAAGLFLRTVEALRAADLGLRRDHLLLVTLDPRNAGQTGPEVVPFFRAVHDRVSAIPGVQEVTFSTVRTVSNSSWTAPIAVEGFVQVEATPQAARDAIGPDFFRTLGIPLLAGRDFTTADDAAAPKVAIVNESFVRRYFAGQDPLGRRVGPARLEAMVVGVVRDSAYAHVRETTPPVWYVPYEQRPATKHLTLMIRTAASPDRYVPDVRAAIASVDKRVPLFDVKSQVAQIDELLQTERMLALLASFFGAVAAALAALGLYGVLAFLVTERRREIGIRMALGARPGTVAQTLAAEAGVWVGLGALVGVPAALALGRYSASILYGVEPLDGVSVVAALSVTAAVAGLAALVPARRAAAVDPMVVLREQ